MMGPVRILKFAVSFPSWSPAFEVFPIFNVERVLVGGFTVGDGPVWNCFVSGKGYPESLYLEEGRCYVTPCSAEDGSIDELIISIKKINDQSIRFTAEES